MDKRNKTVNEIKKEYLWRYQECVRRIRRINAEIPEIRSMKMGIAINNDGMPHGSGQNDLSGYAAELDKLERELTDERYTRIIIYKDIKERIDELKSTNEKDVLFYRYIKGMGWWEIAEKMKFSERQIYRFHGKALKNLEIPKDVSECQSNM